MFAFVFSTGERLRFRFLFSCLSCFHVNLVSKGDVDGVDVKPISPRPLPPSESVFPHSPRGNNRPAQPKASPRELWSPLLMAVSESALIDVTGKEGTPSDTTSVQTIALRRQQRAIAELRVDRSQYFAKVNVSLCSTALSHDLIVVNCGDSLADVTRVLENTPFDKIVHGSGGATNEEVTYAAVLARKNLASIFQQFWNNKGN
jgi:hypothetical protein